MLMTKKKTQKHLYSIIIGLRYRLIEVSVEPRTQVRKTNVSTYFRI